MKEMLQANARLLLLTVLILSNSAVALAFYHPEEGRWISRDPIGEKGFLNSDLIQHKKHADDISLNREMGIKRIANEIGARLASAGLVINSEIMALIENRVREEMQAEISIAAEVATKSPDTIQVYVFVSNNGVNAIDILGLRGGNLQSCLCACRNGTAAINNFCRSLPDPRARAACWAVSLGSVVACNGFCYLFF